MGVSQPKNMMQQISTFFNDKVEDGGQVRETTETIRKIKNCSVCKVQKVNHIVREFANNAQGGGSLNHSTSNFVERNSAAGSTITPEQRMNQEILNLTQREVIEQVIFDPQHGIVKREVHFGIIDYLTVSPLSYYCF